MCGAYGQSTPAPQPAATTLDGVWLGILNAGPQTLRLQLHLQVSGPGSQACALDSLDQKAFGIPCGNVQQKGDAVSFEVPAADFALIVLSNTGPGQDAFTDRLGQHIAQRLSGAAALSLAP